MGDVMIPVLKDTKDPHYRYKMPKLTTKVEGSGNGIKTVITNMSAIAKALDRPPSYPTKYFGCELGAQVTMNHDIYIVNGSHDPDRLLSLLYAFINKFVLCTKCKNPETSLTVSNQTIRQKCIACGHATTIPKTIHKLTTFIINNPPEASTLSVNNSASKAAKPSKSDKRSKKTSSPTQEKNDEGKTKKEKETNLEEDDGFDDEEFTSDALHERLRDGLKNGLISDPKESANLFYELVKQKKQDGLLQDTNVQKELVEQAKKLDLKDKATLVLSEVLFTENILEEIKQYRILFLRFCNENKKAQKYLLGGFEKIVGDVYKDQLFNNSMKILKQFYDEDIIDEETIIEWAAKESKKYVSKEMNRKIHEKVAPLIKWLKEAEEEDSDEEEDDEEKPKEQTAKVNGDQKAETKNGHKQQDNENDDDDDDDDDDLFEFSHRVSGIQIESVKPVLHQTENNVNEEKKEEQDDAEDIDIDNI